MENVDMRKFARYPDTYYYGIRPLVSSTVAEMDDMSVAYPTQSMYDQILDRVYDEAIRMYPDDISEQSTDSSVQGSAEQFRRPPFQRRRLFRDLLGVLILAELLDRRRHYRH